MNSVILKSGKHPSAKRRKGQSGSILILGTLAIFVLFAFMGLAFDASYMFFHKRRMQTAADAGALAGAQELLRNPTALNSTISTSALNDTSLNEFPDATNGIGVVVNHPPVSGPSAGNSGFVEVIITQSQPTWFMRVLNVNSATVVARAVAGLSDGNACVYALNRDTGNPNNGFSINGTADAAFNCGVLSNSNFRAVGGGCVITPIISYTGTYNPASSTCFPAPGNVQNGVAVTDPIGTRFPIPYYSGCDYNNYKATGGAPEGINPVLSPGIYCGGINLGGSVASVTFLPGTYILVGGGMSITSGINVTGRGVTFFNTYPGAQVNKYDGIKIAGGSGVINLTAPISGTYKGLLFYQDPRVIGTSNNGSSFSGGSTSQFRGILYFPSTDLKYAGNSSNGLSGNLATDGYTILIGYNVSVEGNSQINANYSDIGGSNPLQMAAFTE
jgi:hypothetical protein